MMKPYNNDHTLKRSLPQSGFTLMETLVYLALFSVIIGGSVVAGYQIFEFGGRNQTRSMIQEEGDFLLAKTSWMLTGIYDINTPPATSEAVPCTNSAVLTVNKWDATVGNPLVLGLTGTDMTLTRGANPARVLNNSNVQLSNLSFKRCSTGSIDPESVEVSFTLTARTPNGMMMSQQFANTEYRRK